MSTRAMIYIKYPDYFKGIYVHFDGYPSYLGNVLQKFYNDTEKIESLYKCSIEGFEHDGKAVYFEDEDEGEGIYELKNESEMPKYIDYSYLWKPDEKKWYVSEWDKHNWKDLEKVLK